MDAVYCRLMGHFYRSVMIAIVTVTAVGCGLEPHDLGLDLAGAIDEHGEGRVEVVIDPSAIGRVHVALPAFTHVVEIAIDASDSVRTQVVHPPAAAIAPDPEATGSRWLAPRPVAGDRLTVEIAGQGTVALTVWARGPEVEPVVLARSLKWDAAAVLDDPAIAGLGRVMAAIAADRHGGQLFDQWLRTFATTGHSSRPGPTLFADGLAGEFGDDPSAWDLDALPFRVTAVHNRFDLAPREPGRCGELRVTVASVDPIHRPFHLIFLFQQPVGPDDIAPDGLVHCLGTARRWGRLSALDDVEFIAAAREILDRVLTREHFLLAESVEQIVGPWEWRQWLPTGPGPVVAFDNPPLFQTVDVEAVNVPGPFRDEFLAFVVENAEALDRREQLIPEKFRPRSARVATDGARPELDLSGLPAELAGRHPELAARIELMGCPACHTSPFPEFLQTFESRFASDFQFHELESRVLLLDRWTAGEVPGHPLYGPLQPLEQLIH